MGVGRLPLRIAEAGAFALGAALRTAWPARVPVRPDNDVLCLRDRIALLRATITNWPLLLVDLFAPHGTELTYRTTGGATIRCRARTSDLLEAVIVTSGYEYPLEHVRTDDDIPVIVDVGAHIGTFAILVHAILAGRPYQGLALEPMAKNFELLQWNLQANNVNGFTAIHAAAAATQGEALLRTDGPPDTARLDPLATDGERVKTVTLDALCDSMGLKAVSLLKMDIEGGEHEVIASSWPFIAERVKVLLLEFHEEGPGHDLADLRRRLDSVFDVAVLHRGPAHGVLVARRKGSLTSDTGNGRGLD